MRLLLIMLALAGCSDIPRAHSENRIREIAREEAAGLASTVSHNAGVGNRRDLQINEELETLRRRVDTLESENDRLRHEISLLN